MKVAITVICIAAAIAASLYITHETFLAIVTGLVSGLMASLIFVVLLNDLRPKLRISPVIVRGKDRNGGDRLFVKVINDTKADLIQPTATLHAMTVNGPGERDIAQRLPLAADTPMIIARKNHKKRGETPNAYVFSAPIGETEQAKIDRNNSIRFRIVAEHPISGVKKIFEQIYPLDKDNPVEGRFRPGPHFGVDPLAAPRIATNSAPAPDSAET